MKLLTGVRIQALISLLALVLVSMLLVFSSSASKLRGHFNGKGYLARSRTGAGPHIYLDESRELPVAYVGDEKAIESLTTGEASPLSMTSGDFDGDGIDDLLIGYGTSQGGVIAFHRGNLDAFAPQSTKSFEAIGRGDFPSPFLKQASVFSVPVRPDFIATGDFRGSEYKSLVVAARGGTTLYLLSGDGQGNFSNPTAVSLPGGVTAFSVGQLGTGQQYTSLIVGVGGESPTLMSFKGGEAGLSSPACYPLKAVPSEIELGDFGDPAQDVVFLSGGKIQILRTSSWQLQELSLPIAAEAFALGSFIFDRNGNTQIALLTSDGSIHFVAPKEFDPRPFSDDELKTFRRARLDPRPAVLTKRRSFPANNWRIVETVSATTSLAEGETPVMFRTRISSNAADDLMVLNGFSGQMLVISHPNLAEGAVTFVPVQVSTRAYTGSPVAALPMRTNIDGRPGVVALHAGQVAMELMMPLPDPTFFVNRTDDPVPGTVASTCNNVSNVDASSSCSLREAILKANATAGTDTISLAAGTYTLSLPRLNGVYDGKQGTLEILDSVNIVGASQATTIIQAGTTNTNGVDMLMAVNEDINPKSNATAAISNLTMRFGRNRGSVAGTDGDGGCMEFDTGTSGNANLTLTSVTLTDCSTLDGNGAGIATFNITLPGGGSGLATITNSIIQNNSAAEVNVNAAGSGGGVWVSDRARMLMTNTQVINNNANQINGTGRGVGGGLFIFSAGAGSRQTIVHNSTISGNHASGDGGGVWDTSNLLIDNTGGPTVISGNTAGGNGGGIHYHAVSPDVMTLTKVSITGNTATGNGGGIDTGEPSLAHAFTMSFSRLAGNTASSGSNLNNNHSTVTATNNWWGTNSPAGTINNLNSGTTTLDPFIQLIHTASPAIIRINQSSTLTADLSKDNHGSGATLAGNLDVLNALPITFNNAILGTIPQAQPEALSSGALATATFNAGSTSGTGHANATVDQTTITANIVILEPLQITKSFNPTSVAVGASSTLTFSVNNPNVIAVDASFTDSLPAGLVVAATPGVTNTCGGTVTAAAGSGSVSFSNASLPVGACTITVKVSSAADNFYNNSVTINSTAAGTGPQSTSSAGLTVINPPHLVKAFGATTIPLNGTTSLTFTIDSNSNQNLSLSGVAFTDTLPGGLVIAATPNLSNTCGGTATAAAGSPSVSLSGGTIAPNTQCIVSVTVRGTTAGLQNNSVQVTSTNGGTGNTSSTSITVLAPPTISKAFNPSSSIPLNGTSMLTFTINNPNTTAAGDLTGVAFSDPLPSTTGTLVVASTPNVSNTCNGTVTANAGAGSISLSGGTVTHNTSCTISVDVKGTAAGDAANTTGAVSSTEGGTGLTSNTATLKVVAPPSIAKAFGAASIPLNGTTTITFTLTNPAANTTAENGIAFSDPLTNGLQVASTPGVTNTCGGTVTAAANATSISLTSGSIATPGNTCTIVVNVTGTQSGSVSNTTGAVSSTNGGTGVTSNTANLTVVSPPTISKSFNPTTIAQGSTSQLTFTITNPNAVTTLTGVGFTDNLPAGLTVVDSSSTTCSGTLTTTNSTGMINLSGASIGTGGSNTCQFGVTVTGATGGAKNNTTGAISSTEGGTGTTSNTATLNVVGSPTISKSFPTANISTATESGTTVTITTSTAHGFTVGQMVTIAGVGVAGYNGTFTLTGTPTATTFTYTATAGGLANSSGGTVTVTAIPLNGTITLTFAINNPNTTAAGDLTGIAFIDALPSTTGTLVVANTPNVSNTCNGTLTANAGAGSISLSGGAVAHNTSCTISVDVKGTAAGDAANTTGAITSTEGGTGTTSNTATLKVVAPPSIAKLFNPSTIALNATTSLQFTITNPTANTMSANGVAFSDTLPTGLTVANSSSSVCGGTLTTTAPTGTALSGATINTNSQCQFNVTVTGAVAGQYTNITGNVSSTNGGTGNTASANLTVAAPPAILKQFGASTVPLNGTTSLSFTISNTNTGTSLTGLGFTDSLPGGLVIANPPNLTGSCGGTVTNASNGPLAAGDTSVKLSAGTLAANVQCTISVTVLGTTGGVKNNNVQVSSTEGGIGNTSSTSLTVNAPPAIGKSFIASATIAAAPNGATESGSTVTLATTSAHGFTSGQSVIVSGIAVAGYNGSFTITGTPTSTTLTYTNATTGLAASGGGTATSAISSIPLGGSTILSFTLQNNNSTTLNGTGFNDTLPAGLIVSTPNGLTGSCGGGTITATQNTNVVSLSGTSLSANSQCAFSVNVTGIAAGLQSNITDQVTSTEAGNGGTASATLKVEAPPSIAKAFSPSTIDVNATTSLAFTITNPAANVDALTGIAFSDTLPTGLTVANSSSTVCGGTLTTTAPTGIALSGATISTNSQCQFSVTVTGATAGQYTNITGNVSSANGGTGNTASTNLTVSCGVNDVVSNTNDSGAGSLRNAIATACAGDTITFSNTTAGGATNFSDGSLHTIILTSGELGISQSLTITGTGANVLTISGNNASRIFNVQSGTVTISNLKITDGAVSGGNNGGGLLNAGTLTLISTSISGNTTANQGGGIYNSGTLTLINSTLSGNAGVSGGGVYNNNTSTFINTTLSGNTASGQGGGLFNAATGTSINATITNNRSDSDNSGAEQGGGIFRSAGMLTLKNTLVAGNFRGTGATRDDVSGAVDATSSFNLIGDGTNLTGVTNGTSSNQIGTSGSPILAMLGTLGNNGGATQTHLLLPGSPAINAGGSANLPLDTFDLDGDSNTAEPLPVDQRGAGFNRVVGSAVDIGAVEVNYSLTATGGTPQSATINTAFSTALQATVKESGNNQSGLSVTFTAPGSGASGAFTGGNPASASTNASGVATAAVFTANGIAGGPYNVVASLAGNLATTNFALTNTAANQTITVNTHAPSSAVFNTGFMVAATANSGLPVSFTGSGACTNVGANFTMTSGTGVCTVKYDQAGNGNFAAAPEVTESLTAQKANQTITFGALANKTFGNPDFSVSATASSSLAVSFTATGQCTVTGSTVHLTGAGSCTITAKQAGDANFNAAADVPRSFTIAKSNQTITFNALSNKNFGDADFNVSATASSSLAVSFAATGQCTISTNTVHLTGVGSCTITAKQAGDANFNAATDVPQSFTIAKASATTAVSSSANPSNLSQSVTFTTTVTGPAGIGTPTGTVQFKDGGNPITCANGSTSIQTLNASGVATCQTSSLAAGTHTITADYSGDTNFNTSTGMLSPNQVVNNRPLVSFSASTYTVNEADGFVHVVVNRTGDTSAAFNVDYATDDTGASTNCGALNTGLASSRCDYTTLLGTLKFAANQTQGTLDIPINQDSYTEGPESFTVNLSNPTDTAALVISSSATVTINDSAPPAANSIDDTSAFVRQQYHDFLNREPDAPGLAFWKNNIDQCNNPVNRAPGQTLAQCVEVQRILTSAAFFLSIEFQTSGGLVRDFYVASLDRPATNNMPSFVEFERDTQAVQAGVIVGQGSWQTILNNNRMAFMNDFVMRAEFVGLYPTTDTPTQYADKLYLHAGVTPSSSERNSTIAEFGGAATASDPAARGRALLDITQNATFHSREMNRAFVQMEYFGYLRRNPNDLPDNNFNGYNFWLNKLNAFNGDFLKAEMVKAFLGSSEYRQRFGP